jgi:lipopolysaccharide/colanic/teichoic acid biosynthesis glycosyltransferase
MRRCSFDMILHSYPELYSRGRENKENIGIIYAMAKTGVEYLNSYSKRRLDIAGSLALGSIAAPLALPSAVAVGIDNRSTNIFFEQDRQGQNGLVRIRKLRTIKEELTKGPEVRHGTYDPRATVLGTFLRKYGIDEIPQLASVLRGDLALIGPRLTSAASIEEMESRATNIFPEWEEAYRSSRPGLMGPARFYLRQQEEVTDGDLEELMRIEIGYVRNASLINDIRFLGSVPLRLMNLAVGGVSTSTSSPELSLDSETV